MTSSRTSFNAGRRRLRLLLWGIVGSPLFRLTPHACYGVRNTLLRVFGASIGRGTRVRRTVHIDRPWNLSLADRAMIGDRALVIASRSIRIGRGTTISQGAMLLSSTIEHIGGPIAVGEGCWIAADTLLLPGSVVGDGTVVGARSQVSCVLPPNAVAVGVPVSVLGHRVDPTDLDAAQV